MFQANHTQLANFCSGVAAVTRPLRAGMAVAAQASPETGSQLRANITTDK